MSSTRLVELIGRPRTLVLLGDLFEYAMRLPYQTLLSPLGLST